MYTEVLVHIGGSLDLTPIIVSGYNNHSFVNLNFTNKITNIYYKKYIFKPFSSRFRQIKFYESFENRYRVSTF